MAGPELTTVADDAVVVHDGIVAHRFDGLDPDTEYELLGIRVWTLPRPGGELLARVATVNDVHFGEVECGRIDDHEDGPIQRPEAGEPPYPETMNRAVADEIDAAGVDAVLVKGDLTSDGTPAEFAAFEACYGDRFGERLHVVRGNHDAYRGQDRYAGDRWVEVPGLSVGMFDTAIPTVTTGTITHEQLAAMDDRVAASDRPVLLVGHHQQWIPDPDGAGARAGDYFGLHPDASDALDELCDRRRSVIGYAAGHTHRHRVRPMRRSGVPSVEVGCTKDFPGTWAEYRVFEGGVMQVVHRVSSPNALRWSDRCRLLYSDFGVDYETYAMGRLSDRCFVFPERGET